MIWTGFDDDVYEGSEKGVRVCEQHRDVSYVFGLWLWKSRVIWQAYGEGKLANDDVMSKTYSLMFSLLRFVDAQVLITWKGFI